jgi:outer membrane protein TolC
MGRTSGILLFLALAGCADIREARRAQDPDNRRPGERTVGAAEAGLPPGSTLTLDKGISITLKHNPIIAVGRARVEQSQASLEQVASGFLPHISVSADYRWERSGGAGSTPRSGQKIGNSGIVQTQSGGVQVSQLLFDWGKTSSLREQAYSNFVAPRPTSRPPRTKPSTPSSSPSSTS